MCRLPKSWKSAQYSYGYETIQIGAVIINEEHQIISKFDSFVKPEYGKIDTYIRKLTGITNDDVKDAPNLQTVLEQLTKWIPEDVKAVSWSNTDQKQLEYEMSAKNIQIEGIKLLFNNWVDCQKIFGDRLHSTKSYSLQYALQLADIPYLEGVHNGLIDAWNTALLFVKLLEEPDLKLNAYYLEAQREEKTPLTFSMAGLFSDFQFIIPA